MEEIFQANRTKTYNYSFIATLIAPFSLITGENRETMSEMMKKMVQVKNVCPPHVLTLRSFQMHLYLSKYVAYNLYTSAPDSRRYGEGVQGTGRSESAH